MRALYNLDFQAAGDNGHANAVLAASSPTAAPGGGAVTALFSPTHGGATGLSSLLDQHFNAATGQWEFSGNADIDGVLIGAKWEPTTLTFSFPTTGLYYGHYYYDQTYPDGQVPFNAAQQTAARYAFNLIGSYTNLTITEITETAGTHANVRLSQTSDGSLASA